MSKRKLTISDFLFEIILHFVKFLSALSRSDSRKWVTQAKKMLVVLHGNEKIADLLFTEAARFFDVCVNGHNPLKLNQRKLPFDDVIRFQHWLLLISHPYEKWQEQEHPDRHPFPSDPQTEITENQSLKTKLLQQRASLTEEHLWARFIAFGVLQYVFTSDHRVKSPPFYTVIFFAWMLYDFEPRHLRALNKRIGGPEKSSDDWSDQRNDKVIVDIQKRFHSLLPSKQLPGEKEKAVELNRWAAKDLSPEQIHLIEKTLRLLSPWVQVKPGKHLLASQDAEHLIKWLYELEKKDPLLADCIRCFVIIHPAYFTPLVGSTSEDWKGKLTPEKLPEPVTKLSPIKLNLSPVKLSLPSDQEPSMNHQSSTAAPSSENPPEDSSDESVDPIEFEGLEQILAQDAARRKKLGDSPRFLILVDGVGLPEAEVQLRAQAQVSVLIPMSSHRIEVKASDDEGQVPLALLFLEHWEITRPSWFSRNNPKRYWVRLEGGQSLRFRVQIQASNTEEPSYAVEIDYCPAHSIPFIETFRQKWMIPALVTAGLLIVLGLGYALFFKKQHVLPPDPIVKKPVPVTPPAPSPVPPKPEMMPPPAQQVQKPAPPKPKSRPKAQPPVSESEPDVPMHAGDFEGAQTLSEVQDIFLVITQNGSPVEASLQSVFEQALKNNGYTPVREVTLSDTILFATLKPVDGKDTFELEVRLENRVKKVLWPNRKAVMPAISVEAIHKILPKK